MVVGRAALFVLHRLVENVRCRVRVVPPSLEGSRVRRVISALVFWSPYRVVVCYRGGKPLIAPFIVADRVLNSCSIYLALRRRANSYLFRSPAV